MGSRKSAHVGGVIVALLGGLGAWLAPGTAGAQGYPPAEAAARMTPGEGLEVTLYASEPLVRQPVAIEFDDRGRMWVIQYLQYPNPEGLKRVEVDRYSRTVYDRVPEPPPHGPRGADRITILEDRDGDGHAETAKDFVDGLNLATGIAFGHGGVFVLQTPYLLFYPDRDRDDRPDGDPEVLVKGFGMEDAHSVANSLTWGPDGWLYGCQGSTVTARIGEYEFQQGVWRYHPLTRKFELFCEGGGNSWGLDFDEHGQLLYSTNVGGYTMLHAVQGGYYWKSFGKHGALHNPYAYGYFDHVPHENFTGGHVTVGGVVYQSTAIPQLRGKYVAGDLLGHAAYWHDIERVGSTFRSRHGGTLLLSNDTWFAPTDMLIGPDGALYITDWHDQRTAHPDPDANWDRRNGRIFRIAPPNTPLPRRIDPNSVELAELIEMVGDADEVRSRWARRQLADRREVAAAAQLADRLFAARDERLALRYLWALYVSGGWTDELGMRLLDHAFPTVRMWAVRFFGDACEVTDDVARKFELLAREEPDVRVRAQLACSARRLSATVALPTILALADREEDRTDPYQPLLVWWAIEQHALEARPALVDYFTQPAVWENKLTRDVLLPRLMERYSAEYVPETLTAAVRLLDAAPEFTHQQVLLAALDRGLPQGERQLPEDVTERLERLWRAHPSDATLLRLMARSGSPEARRRALQDALDPNQPAASRVVRLRLLAELHDPASVEPLLAALEVPDDPDVQRQLVLTLARFDQPIIGEALLAAYLKQPPQLSSLLAEVLLGRRSWAGLLLRAVDQGRVSPSDIAVEAVRQVAVHDDVELDELVRKHWGRLSSATPEEKLAEVRRLNNDLRAGSGDFERGRGLFKKHCAVCHRLGEEGALVGPELTHANRKDRQFLLVSLVDPSSVVRKEYTSYVVQTVDGRVLTGVIVEQTPQRVTLVNNEGKPQTIPREDIETLDESPLSLMPENLLQQLSPQELRDLFAFLEQS